MNKINKFVLAGVCGVVALAGCAACSGGEAGETGKKTTYTMEAEYTNLDGIQGGGISNSADGVDIIMGDGETEGASNGYFVGYTFVTGYKIQFDFTSSTADSAKLVLRMCTELPDITINNSILEIKVNDGAEIQFNDLFIAGSPNVSEGKFNFADYTIANSIQLKEGANKITITVKANTLLNGNATGAPDFDCIKLTTKSALTFTEKTENITNKGSV